MAKSKSKPVTLEDFAVSTLALVESLEELIALGNETATKAAGQVVTAHKRLAILTATDETSAKAN